MGPKTSHLTLVITDPDGRHTGASVIFTRDGFPQGIYRRGVGVDETVPVPAVPFRVTVEAEGYEPWHYGGAKWQGDAGLVNLKPGQTLSLDVRLRKK